MRGPSGDRTIGRYPAEIISGAPRGLPAERIHCPESLAIEKNRLAGETAMPPDPVADRRWIGGTDSARRFFSLSRILVAVQVDHFRRMKAEDCAPGDADSAARDGN